MAVTITIEATPPFPPGTIVGAYEKWLLAGPAVHQAPGLTPAAIAQVSTVDGRLTFAGLKPARHYYAGAEVEGRWMYVGFTTHEAAPLSAAERERAEAREAQLTGELLGLPGPGGGIGPVLREAGRVELWGLGASLAQGLDPQSTTFPTPVEGYGLKKITKVAGGGQAFTLLLDNLGRVWHSGGSTFGQAGDGTALDKRFAHVVPLPAGEVAIDASGHSDPMALLSTGRVAVWGANAGQLSIGYDPYRQTSRWKATYARSAPGQILTGVKGIYGGHISSFFLMANGSVRRAGEMQLQATYVYATEVAGVSNVVKVAGSKTAMVVLLPDGSLRAKGFNGAGELGNGQLDTTTAGAVPWVSPLIGPTAPAPYTTPKVVDIEVSEHNVIALLADATVRVWGRNHRFQCGNGHADANTDPPTVTAVGGGAITARIDSGQVGGTGKVLTVTAGEANIRIGAIIKGTGVLAGQEVIASLGTGKWTVSQAQSVSSRAMTAMPLWKVDWSLVPTQKTYQVFWRSTGLTTNITGSLAAQAGGAFVGRISGTTLTVESGGANVHLGCELGTTGGVEAGTEVLAELSPGVYEVSIEQEVPAGTSMTAEGVGVLTVTAGAAGVHAGCELKGGGIKGGTKVVKEITATEWTVSKEQTVASTSIEVLPDKYGPGKSTELGEAVTTYTITGWAEPVIEVQVRGNAPVTVPYDPGLTNVKAIMSGGGEESGGFVPDYYHMVLKTDGSVWGWGSAKVGNLGNGNLLQVPTPIEVMPAVKDAIGIGGTEGHAAVIRPGEPTVPLRLTAVAVPATKDVLVTWIPEPGERVTGWKVEWERAENKPDNKPEGLKHDTQSGTSSGNLPALHNFVAGANSHTIKGVADAENPGLPLPQVGWPNGSTNLLEVRVIAKYTPAKPTATVAKIGPRKWRISWTETEGPLATVFNADGTAEVRRSPEPGWIVHYRLRSSEAFSANPTEELPPVTVGTTNHVDVTEIPEGVTLEAEVKGTFGGFGGNARWNVRIVSVLPNEQGAEVPILIAAPGILGSTAPGGVIDGDREVRVNTSVQYVDEGDVTGKAGAWTVPVKDKLNAKGEKEPGFIVQYKTIDKYGWNDPLAKGGEVVVGPGAQTVTVATTAKPEARVLGARGTKGGETPKGDTVTLRPGVWGGSTPITSTVLQWYRQYRTEGNNELIAGATGATYQATPRDAGYALRCEERASNAVGEVNYAVGKLGSKFVGEPSMPVIGD